MSKLYWQLSTMVDILDPRRLGSVLHGRSASSASPSSVSYLQSNFNLALDKAAFQCLLPCKKSSSIIHFRITKCLAHPYKRSHEVVIGRISNSG